jgi:outer membrane protein assembly factor BamD
MNRLLLRTSVFVLAAMIALSPGAMAKTRHKKKKNVDLSANPLANVHSQQPDKILFDKAAYAMKKGKYDVARLDLQTLLNTYSESEYAMRAKLLVGDTWMKEGGSAALAQAESEYKDFITFFPNTPEAAEAQMKVGDIYFEQMEKPDRDPQNAENSEREYRTMLEQFPDSPLVPRAKQRLREVQEVLAQRQYEIGEYYASRENWAATIARLQTVADTYPLFSHSDQTLITIGDAYANEAQLMGRVRGLTPAAMTELTAYYNKRAVAAWDEVVTRYPLAPHVEDAKDRLIAMGSPVPDPSQQALAESQAEEDSRVPLHIGKRALSLVSRGPDTVHAARVGDPSLDSPPPVLAPEVLKQSNAVLQAAAHGQPLPTGPAPAGSEPITAAISNGGAGNQPGSEPQPAKLNFEEVPDGGSAGNSVTVAVPNGGAAAAAGGGGATSGPAGEQPAVNAPVHSNSEPLVQPAAPTTPKPLPAIDKPADAASQVNEVPAGGSAAQVQTGATATGKQAKKKNAYNKKDESSSKHKKKTGVDKLNPF